MVAREIEDQFKSILATTRETLAPFGYKKDGQYFRRFAERNCAVIYFQKSRFNSEEDLNFTIEIGVVVRRLLDNGQEIKKAGLPNAHLRRRLGVFLSEPQDKWWVLTRKTDAAAVVKDIRPLLLDHAIPFLEEHMTDAKIESVLYGGLPLWPEKLRNKYLAEP